MKFVLVTCLLGLASTELVAASGIKTDEGVLVLTTGNFQQALSDHHCVLVEYYTPSCEPCKPIAPEYVKAAKALAGKESQVKLAKVDASEEKELAMEHGVRRYPTLKFYSNGREMDYDGGLTADEIVNWLLKESGPAVKTVRQVSAASASVDNGPVPSILPPFNLALMNRHGPSASASAESTNNGLPFNFNMNLPGASATASAQSTSDLSSFPFTAGPSNAVSASASVDTSDGLSAAFPFGTVGASNGASAGASASASVEGLPAALSGAGVVVTSGPQSSPLEPFCSCVVRGNCAGREAYTRQFDAVAHLQCGGEFERCCYPCPYPGMIDNFAHVIPCSPIETCNRYYGQAPTDIAQFGVLGPCPGMGTVRCIDYLLHTQAHTTVSQDVQVDVTAEAPAPPPVPIVPPVVTFVPEPIAVVPHAPVVSFVPQPIAVVPPAPVAVPALAAVPEPVVPSVATATATAGFQPAAFSRVYPPSLWYRWGNSQFTLVDLFNPFKKWKKLFG